MYVNCIDTMLSRSSGKKGDLKELNSYMSSFPNRHHGNKIIRQILKIYSHPRQREF